MDGVKIKYLPHFIIFVGLLLCIFSIKNHKSSDVSELRVTVYYKQNDTVQKKIDSEIYTDGNKVTSIVAEEKIETTSVPEPTLPDGEWAQFSQTEALKYYTDFELRSMKGHTALRPKCDRSYLNGQCCIGAVSVSGSSAWTPRLHTCGITSPISVPYYTYWKTKHMYDFANIGKTLANDSQIALVGDSVQNQMYEALICAMLRRDEWTVFNQTDSGRIWQRCCWGMGRILNTTLVHAKTKKVLHVAMHREYKMNHETILPVVCADSDVVIFNYGLHWNYGSTHKEDMQEILSTISKCLQEFPKLTVIWRETTPQHFLQPGGHWIMYSNKFPPATNVRPKDFLANVSDSFGYDKSCEDWNCQNNVTEMSKKKNKCSKISYIDEDLERNWKGKEVLSQLKKVFSVSITSALNENSKKIEHDSSRPRVYFTPVFELFEPLWNFHTNECTHYCYSPLIWQPVLSGIFKAIKHSAVYMGSHE